MIHGLAESFRATAECATVFRELGMPSGNSRLKCHAPSPDTRAADRTASGAFPWRSATSPLSDLDLGEFEFVVALTKSTRRALLEYYGVEESKIRNVYVVDPFGSDIEQYMKCASAISKRLAEVEFTNNSK